MPDWLLNEPDWLLGRRADDGLPPSPAMPEIADLYGVGPGQIPMDHIYAAANLSAGTITTVPNAGGAGSMFQLGANGDIPLDGDGFAVMTNMRHFQLSSDASVIGTRVFVAAGCSGSASNSRPQTPPAQNDRSACSGRRIAAGPQGR